MKMSISFVVAMGMTASLFAGERSTETSRDQKRVRKEENLSKQLEIEEIVEFVLPTISDYVTEDGKLVIAGVTSVKRDEQGRTIIEIKYNGDFEEDFVLTIPRPVFYDEQGVLIGIQGPDKVRILEDHAVYIFDSVEAEKGVANKAGPMPSASNAAGTMCRTVVPTPGGGAPFCKSIDDGCTSPAKPLCDWLLDSDGDLYCDCQAARDE